MPIDKIPMPGSLHELAGWAVAGIVGGFVGLRKLWLSWRVDGLRSAEVDVNTTIIEQLRSEVVRLAKQNGELNEQLTDLRRRLTQLTDEVVGLNVENGRLRARVQDLVAELQGMRAQKDKPPEGGPPGVLVSAGGASRQPGPTAEGPAPTSPGSS